MDKNNMTYEDRRILMTCLCSLLPYGVVCKASDGKTLFLDGLVRLSEIDPTRGFAFASEYNKTWTYRRRVELSDIKPYLRPMSSMTEKEKEEYKQFDVEGYVYSTDCVPRINWLNAHHFDLFDLIEKGLALEAPEDIYNNLCEVYTIDIKNRQSNS